MGASSSTHSATQAKINISSHVIIPTISNQTGLNDKPEQISAENEIRGGLPNKSPIRPKVKVGGQNTLVKSRNSIISSTTTNPYVASRLRTRMDPDEHYLEAIKCKDIEILFEPPKGDKVTLLKTMKSIRKMKERIYG